MADRYLENIKFLIAEDNAFMRTIIRRVLGTLGVESINEASNGGEAMKAMHYFQPDIAIVDLGMEPMDGLEFVRKVRTDENSPNPYLPIIMLSGHSEQNRITVARDAGVTEFVVKPISVKILFDRISKTIEKPRPFVRAETYFGPDRRRRKVNYQGQERRTSAPNLVVSQ